MEKDIEEATEAAAVVEAIKVVAEGPVAAELEVNGKGRRFK